MQLFFLTNMWNLKINRMCTGMYLLVIGKPAHYVQTKFQWSDLSLIIGLCPYMYASDFTIEQLTWSAPLNKHLLSYFARNDLKKIWDTLYVVIRHHQSLRFTLFSYTLLWKKNLWKKNQRIFQKNTNLIFIKLMNCYMEIGVLSIYLST